MSDSRHPLDDRGLYLGLDVSTSVTGVCILDSSLKILEIDRVEFKGCNDLWEKADKMKERLMLMHKNHVGDFCVALEEPLLGFQKGMSSATTITTLMRFNGIVSYISRDIFGINPVYIGSAHARKLCGIKMQKTTIAGLSGKEQVFKYMSENDLKDISWPKKKNGKEVDWSRDATDAYVIAKASFLSKNHN